MKRLGAVTCLVMLVVMLTSSFAFADTFQIESTYPKNGAKNTTKDNMCVKVYFNHDVGNDASVKNNADKFSIKDEDGKVIPSLIYYSDKNPKYALILVDTTKVKQTGDNSIKDNSVYTIELSSDFMDNEGNKLGNDPNRVIEVKTLNQGRNTMIYMVMMFAMFGGMMIFTMRQSTKEKKEEENPEKDAPFNPYKEAKRTGKSVEEVIEAHNKEVAKKKAKEERRRKYDAMLEDDDEPEEGVYRVKRPAPIAAAGGKYISGRKAIAEAKAAEEAAHKAELKATNYGKNPKKGKK